MDIALLNFYLGIFLVVTAFGPIPKTSLKSIRHQSQKISPLSLVGIIATFSILTLWLLTSNAKNFLVAYINIAFSLTLIGHAYWLSLGKSKKERFPHIVVALSLITLKIFWSSHLINNLFLIVSISWLGQFLVKTKLLNPHRLTFISIIWLFYDIIFVWLTPLSQAVNTNTQALNVPLGIMVGTNLIGTGDLLWASMLLALTSGKLKSLIVIILLLSNIALDLYAVYSQNITAFPLLVLWVPLGLLTLYMRGFHLGGGIPKPPRDF